MNAGDTFLPPVPYNHLYMVISDPSIDPSKVVMVSFTTHTPNEEQLCIVEKGEHPFVKVKTVVRYKDARCSSATDIEKAVSNGSLATQAPLSEELLMRIRDGAALSDFLPEGCRKVLVVQGII